jgi:hypothetical protein
MTRQLVDALKAQGGILAEVVGQPDAAAEPGPAQRAAAGPRAAAAPAEYELLLEMILEGSRLHYGSPRVVKTDDPDLALLLGDQLYALGLARLAGLGDLEAVRILAETIASLAQAHAEGQAGRGEEIWNLAADRIGRGAGPQNSAAGPVSG